MNRNELENKLAMLIGGGANADNPAAEIEMNNILAAFDEKDAEIKRFEKEMDGMLKAHIVKDGQIEALRKVLEAWGILLKYGKQGKETITLDISIASEIEALIGQAREALG